MLPYLQKLHDVLAAAEALLAAREAEMLTSDEWDGLEHAVAAATEPPPDERDETLAEDRLVLLAQLADAHLLQVREPFPDVQRHALSP
jgi:hypothetical protein